ncbi:MAG TPA: circularly permuted type 2 ATP-grasp protein [Fimbriiglobus sp.]|jgi:uncharacterized circularly permuted ATP-grasp superfamily protein
MSDPIARYHDLLGRGSLAADSQGRLDSIQNTRELLFGTRPVCTVLRPRFLTAAQYRFLMNRVGLLLPAFQAVYDRGLADPAFRKQFGLHGWEENLLAIDPGFSCPSPTSRFDSFFVSESELRFTEYNTETPAGAGYSDALAEIFYGLPVFQEFQQQYHVLPIPAKPGILHALLDSFYTWQGNRNTPPRIAILDWREVPTFSEFVLFYDYFKAMGVEARIIDPRDLEFANGKLMAGDYHITLIYKRVLISELFERCGLDNPVVRAIRDRAVCMANSFRCKILFKKASFAVVGDERNAGMFTPEQNEAIAEHIPWTRVVEDRKTTIEGKTEDLLSYIAGNKDRLVLKPNDDYGGKGIVLGWTVEQGEWEKAVNTAVESPYVVQRRVRLPYEPFPSYENGKLVILDRMLDTNPYVAFGQYMHGCLTRISTEALVNVTAGGGSTVPTFLIEPR